MDEMARRHGRDAETVERLMRLRRDFIKLGGPDLG